MTESTVAAWDGSSASEASLEWAALRETRRGRPLSVVRILPVPRPTSPDDLEPRLEVDASERHLLHRVARLRRAHPDLSVSCEVLFGDVVEVLLGSALRGATVVVGRDSRPRLEARRHRVAAQLATLATGPVVIVPEHGRPPATADEESLTRSIVVGVDGTHAALEALRFAADEARQTGDRLVAVHVWSEPVVWDDVFVSPPALEALMQHQHEELLEESIEVGLTDFPDVPVVRRVVRGRPEVELERLARHADVLVVGDHARSAVARHLLGSVSSALSARPTVPTVVVHHPADAPREAARRSRDRVEA
ncbi:Universal stress protein [Frondihabitans sp. 762G35]|uniref:universal stress protein n=1 Tax=Frondihabitans sp. 762G35 TaxID=1446794 RepID=UPI000D207C93|nr:universal stress protein [Frondihabitans sp. 762G35]ARC56980.1 Universal stress protein [Frondihabitans sp. 762G35]